MPISIFIPVWNDARWLPGAIESVLDQTYPHWELIIGDNASDDDLQAIVAGYSDARVRYHRWSTHTPAYENQNRTWTLCRYAWSQLLCADDRLEPHCLARLVEAMARAEAHPRRIAAVIGGCRRVDEVGRPAQANYSYQRVIDIPDGIYGGAEWLHYAAQPGIAPWNFGAVALSQEVLAEMGGFLRPDVGLGSDVEVIMRASVYGEIAYVAQPLLRCTVRTASDRALQARRNRERNDPYTPMGAALLSALRAHEVRRRVSPRERREIFKAIARSHLQRAVLHRFHPGGGGRAAALVDITRAARYCPSGLLDPGNLTYLAAALVAPPATIERARNFIASRRHARAAATLA